MDSFMRSGSSPDPCSGPIAEARTDQYREPQKGKYGSDSLQMERQELLPPLSDSAHGHT